MASLNYPTLNLTWKMHRKQTINELNVWNRCQGSEVNCMFFFFFPLSLSLFCWLYGSIWWHFYTSAPGTDALTNLLSKTGFVLFHAQSTERKGRKLLLFAWTWLHLDSINNPDKLFKTKNNDALHALVQVLHHVKNTNPTPCPSLCHWPPQRPTCFHQTHWILCPHGHSPIFKTCLWNLP